MFRFKNSIISVSIVVIACTAMYAQKGKSPFIGTLTYQITICDTALQKFVPTRYMRIHTNDTLTRIENESDRLGIQVVIKHLQLNKSYLLLQTPFGKYAIQTDHNQSKSDSILPYTFKKKLGKKRICGLKATKTSVRHKGFQEPMIFYCVKNYSPKYLNTFENAPGLPLIYYIPTNDGLYKYELINVEKNHPAHDLFGVPSDFKRVTFDQFMEEVMKTQEIPENEGEKK
ncbi:MAG: hypothetical protein LW688_04985 [Cryomorphaceae bacterium]|nr:hypothetical protein [Cryomorphaceae bacterium]